MCDLHFDPCRTYLYLFAACVLLFTSVRSARGEAVRVFRLGNSHTNSIKEEFLGVVGASGHTDFVHDQHTVPGAPIWWLYDRAPRDSIEKLKNNAWDVVIFQTYNATTEHEKECIGNYTAAAREGNPDVRVIMYTIWPTRANWLEPDRGRTEAWTEEVAGYLRDRFPGLDVAVAPTSLIIRRISDLADEGLIPEMDSHNDLYQDAGHMGLYGGYAIGTCFTAMIFGESPIGYPHQMLEYGRDGFTDEVKFQVNPKAALAMQKVIWDVLAEYEEDGLDTGLWINSGRIAPALVGKAYDREVPVVNVSGTVALEVAAGDLPAGLELSGTRITGTPTEKGIARFTLRARDEESSVERELILPVEEDLPLTVPDVERGVQADQYIMDELRANGAIGKPRWVLAGGELPAGLLLLESGLIMGTPAEQGTFEATVRATDRHPEQPRTAEGEVVFKVGPPDEETIIVPLVESTVNTGKALEGQDLPVDEFPHEITDGEGNVVARFAVVAYLGDEKFREKRPEKFAHLLLLVKGEDREGEGYPLESVHLYMDTNHNREVIYNEDDEHYYFRTKSGPEYTRRVRIHGYRPTRHVRSTFGEFEDGWVLAVRHDMPSGFGVHNISRPVTYGFNVAAGSEKDPEKRYYWQGDARSDTDTSFFGSILIPE